MGIMGPKFFGFFVRYEKWDDTGVFVHTGMQLASLLEEIVGRDNLKIIDSDEEYVDFELSNASCRIHAKNQNDSAKAIKAVLQFTNLKRFEVTPLISSSAQTLFTR
ncbi:hypothetical protein [Acidovorax sp. BLS4]|uniref:hypothetical protein n=1 Tax=Acidovorax sp. BLS4 TaxID=3273430 RepID=UPI0029435434|nr:hypothetical protein [Paracidovorax avenae]WOI46517.1 hypothetical protein R1Z03_04680 [Paracidovorax avenae]